MTLPSIVARDEWTAARKELLAKETQHTRLRDELHAARRALPMVQIHKKYLFEGADGEATPAHMFDGCPLAHLTPLRQPTAGLVPLVRELRDMGIHPGPIHSFQHAPPSRCVPGVWSMGHIDQTGGHTLEALLAAYQRYLEGASGACRLAR